MMDSNVRGFVQGELFEEFGALTLEEAQMQKGAIFERVREATIEQFAPLGITITSLGGSEGLIYTDPNVQAVINRNFEAQQERVRAEAAATAQAIENARLINQANAAATATVIAGDAAADVLRTQGEQLYQFPGLVDYEIARRSQGQVPQILVVGDGSGSQELPFSFFLDGNTLVQPDITPVPQP